MAFRRMISCEVGHTADGEIEWAVGSVREAISVGSILSRINCTIYGSFNGTDTNDGSQPSAPRGRDPDLLGGRPIDCGQFPIGLESSGMAMARQGSPRARAQSSATRSTI